jgi:predicted transposase/invertase (TIGR01784 family)
MSKKLIRFDWAIKYILRDKANFDVLEGFLAALLEDNEIRIIKILESESSQEDENNKFNRVDILVEDHLQRKIIIEVQNTRESDYLERLLFGTSKTMVDNLQLGSRYKNIDKIISISILYFNLGTGDDYLYKGSTEFKGMNTGNSLIVKEKVETTDSYGKIEIRFKEKDIFPEYYLIRVEKYEDTIRKAIDEWVYMLKHNMVKDDFKSKNIESAAQKLEEMNMTEEEKTAYWRYLDSLAREKDQLETAKIEGKEEGIKLGIEQEQIKIITNGFKAGVTIEMLSIITGLEEVRIIAILKENGYPNI